MQKSLNFTFRAATIIACCLFGLVAVAVGIKVIWHVAELKKSQQVSVGMTKQDVRSQWGEPHDAIEPNQPLRPLNVSGFTPGQVNDGGVWVYRYHVQVYMFVFFDPNGLVKCIYWCTT